MVLSPLLADAAVKLAPLFQNGAVLQRDQPLPVWGQASSGETIRVQLGTTIAETKVAPDGRWLVQLPPQTASSRPVTLIVSDHDGAVTVHDILVGDLWLCSGQSNMEWLVERSANATQEIAAADFPLIRHFKVPHLAADQPQADAPGEWIACSPQTAGSFSAVAFFFARNLHRTTGIPIGLINCSWGGTPIESWMSAEAIRADPAAPAILAQWEKRLAAYAANQEKYRESLASSKAAQTELKAGSAIPAPRPPRLDQRWHPSGLYNAMIAPFVPAALRGVIWYQGEANAPLHSTYASLFTGMIKQWRTTFGRELPFYFVQLANHNRESDTTRLTWAYLREAQASALLLPATGMAVTIDIGEIGDVHPKNKQEVGRRLSLIARAQLEKEPLEYSGPRFIRATPEGSVIRAQFDHANGLNSGGRTLSAFEIAGDDLRYCIAQARIDENSVILSSSQVPRPVAVRYAWHNFPEACLFNAAGLPASPFRSHD